MDTLRVMWRNGWTTFTGLVSGFTYYIVTSGVKVPSTKEELKALVVGASLFALGLTAKSATTGSQPS